jgi:TPR repeat protein
MEKYFTVAIEKGNSDAMYCMGIYYEDRRNDTMTVKYYTMAIEKGNTDAMCRMGMYNDIYRKRNIDDMIKYFMMAIENGNSKAMCQLGLYYEHVRDYDNMEKYYMMSIDKGYSSAMYFLGNYYERVSSGSGLKYFMMGVEKKCPYCMSEVAIHHERHENYDEMEKYYLLAFEADKTFSTAADSLVKYYHTKNKLRPQQIKRLRFE